MSECVDPNWLDAFKFIVGVCVMFGLFGLACWVVIKIAAIEAGDE